MNRRSSRGVCIILFTVLAQMCAIAAELPAPALMQTPLFGAVSVYKPLQSEPDSVALFVSGDSGSNSGASALVRALIAKGTVVIGVDGRRFLAKMRRSKASCEPLAVEFELLSHQMQKQIGLRDYHVPILVGLGSGAALVYATLAQAPPGTFAGAVTLGFCPQQDFGGASICAAPQLRYKRGNDGALVFEPAPHLEHPWIALQSQKDAACPAAVVDDFVAHTGGAAIVHLPPVGRGVSAERNWMPQFLAAYQGIATLPEPSAAQAPEIQDLPITTVRAVQDTDTLALLLTGDGGWAGLDRELAARLAARGVSTVGFNSLRYFWHLRTPDEAARDVTRVLEHYLADWKKSRFILIGYSFGADVAPFIVNRLPPELRNRLVSVSLLGIESDADFVVRVADWIPGSDLHGRDVRPELAAIEVPVQCIYGAGESTTICPAGKRGRVSGEQIGSGHHFGGDYSAIADHILAFAQIMSRHN